MSKYVIKNCPALTDQGECYQGSVFMGTAFKECHERTDCLLKRIVDECNNAKQRAKDFSTNAYSGGIYDEANRILQLLEIEEVDE